MMGKAERGREAYDAASYDQDGNVRLGGHGRWDFGVEDINFAKGEKEENCFSFM